MSGIATGESLFRTRLRQSSGQLFWLGVAMVAVGVIAIAFPMASTLAVEIFVGWMLMLSGVVMLAGSFSIQGTGPFFAALLLSLFSIAAAVYLLFNPLAGAAALTLTVGALFVIQGAYEVVFAFELRPLSGWVAMLISGLASIILAILIAAGWPATSMVVLGILLGVNFVSTGLAYLFLSRMLQPAKS